MIYVRDLLSRYQPDAFRYFVAAAGPENQDSDFTWAEFVRRTNDELVAGWGNLVNRTATLIAKNFGEIPAAGELTAEDQALLDRVEAAFDTVGDLIGRHRQKAGDRRGDARRRRGEQVRLRLRAVEAQGRRPARAARHGPARDRPVRRRPATRSSRPFLPFTRQRGRRVLGGTGDLAPMPRIEEVEDLDGGAGVPDHHRRLHRRARAGSARRSRPGTPVAKPTPVFTKLDPSVVDEELAAAGRVTGRNR